MTQRRVLVIILDAFDKTLLDQWMQSGELPHLSRLREQGIYGSLGSTTSQMNGVVWPTFVSGVWPGDHGVCHHLMWRPENMKFQRPTAEWVGFDPFWNPLGRRGRDVVALDLPYVHLAVHRPRGVELREWGTHYKFMGVQSNPPQLLNIIGRQYGRYAIGSHQATLKRSRDLLPLRRQLLASVEKELGVARYVMRAYPWQLFMVNFAAPHLGGHEFWDESGLRDAPSEADSELLATTLPDIYRACDEAVGKLTKATGEQATVLLLSLTGMGANNSLADVLADMVGRVLGEEASQSVAGAGVLQRLRQRLPVQWRSAVKSRLPGAWQDWLALFWRGKRAFDWQTTTAFTPLPDLQGYVRINLQGREAQGIVTPGEVYDQLWHKISAGLHTFVDADTGRPVVRAINTPAELFPPGDRLYLLPDLIVQWSEAPARSVRAVTSPEFGTIAWPTPGRIPNGSAGYHTGDGWLMAAGPGIEAGAAIKDAHMIDIAPTLYSLLEEQTPAHLQGQALALPGLNYEPSPGP